MTTKLKNVKGITLIALVITIIVLLILAGVSIATLTGENGILGQAQRAKNEVGIQQEKEQIYLGYQKYQIDIIEGSSAKLKVEGAIVEGEKPWTITFANGNKYIVTVDEESININGPLTANTDNNSNNNDNNSTDNNVPISENNEVIIKDNTGVVIPEDETVILTECNPENYEFYPEIVDVSEKNLEGGYTLQELLESAGVHVVNDNEEMLEFRTEEDELVDLDNLNIVTKLMNFEFKIQGELVNDRDILECSIPDIYNVIKGKDKESIIIVQFDLDMYDNADEITPYFIKPSEIDADGRISATFPTTGPFFICIDTTK